MDRAHPDTFSSFNGKTHPSERGLQSNEQVARPSLPLFNGRPPPKYLGEVVLPSFSRLGLNGYQSSPLKRTRIAIAELVTGNPGQVSESDHQRYGNNQALPPPTPVETPYGHPGLYSTTAMEWQHSPSSLNGTNSLLIDGQNNSLPAPRALKVNGLSTTSKEEIHFGSEHTGTGDWIGSISNEGTKSAHNAPEVSFIISSNHHPDDKRIKFETYEGVPDNFGADFYKSHSRWETNSGPSRRQGPQGSGASHQLGSREFSSRIPIPSSGSNMKTHQNMTRDRQFVLPTRKSENQPPVGLMESRQRQLPRPICRNGVSANGMQTHPRSSINTRVPELANEMSSNTGRARQRLPPLSGFEGSSRRWDASTRSRCPNSMRNGGSMGSRNSNQW